MEPLIPESSARAMVRLLGETAANEGTHADKKRFLMDGLCRLIGADAWAWSLNCNLVPGEAESYVSLLHGGFDEDRLAKMIVATEHPHTALAMRRFYQRLADADGLLTMARHEVDADGLAESGDYGERWMAADIGPMLLAAYRVDERSASGLVIYRRHGAPRFSELETRMTHIILEEVPWLHLSGWPEDRGVTVPRLSPRQRTVMNLLLDGMSRKSIANYLGIAENTVSGYVKEIYRHFRVSSQPELMHKFMMGKR